MKSFASDKTTIPGSSFSSSSSNEAPPPVLIEKNLHCIENVGDEVSYKMIPDAANSL